MIGLFQTWKGVNVNGIIKINSSGSTDTSFNTGGGFNSPSTLTTGYLDDYNRLLLLGSFTQYSGSTTSGSLRALPNGTIDPDFPVGSILRYNTASFTLSPSIPVAVIPTPDKKSVYVFAGYNWQNGVKYLSMGSGSNANPVRLNLVDPEIQFSKSFPTYDTDYSQTFTDRSLVDKGYVDSKFSGSSYITGSLLISGSISSTNIALTGSAQLTGSLTVTGSINFYDLLSLSPVDPLPIANVPTGSIASSGSDSDNKPYYWNGSTWTALF